jgi:hypothetical protein
MEIYKIIVLVLSGLLLTFVGVSRMSNPIKNYSKNSGINLAKDVNLLNEMRGVGSVMMFAGIINFTGIFLPQLMILAFTAATLIFFGFAIGRISGIMIDGKPNPKIIQGLMFELLFSGLQISCLILSVN